MSLALVDGEIWVFLLVPDDKFAKFGMFVLSLRGRRGVTGLRI